MENLPAAQPTANQLRLASRTGWAILIVATLYVCYFSHLGAIGFVGPDEPRYAWIARAMAETGDWVTPRLYGKPWFEKPPLFYWEAALCFKLFGVSEAAARLPSAVSALLATLALAWLAWRMYGAETARWLLLLLPTTVGMIGFSHAAATDMPFSGTLAIAMVFAAVLLGLAPNLNQSPSLASFTSFTSSTSVLFGFFLGLAVLAKGPVGIVLCGGAVFMWALFTKRWRDAFRLLHPAAIAAFYLTALPWYILCSRRNPDFFRVFIIEHNFKRYLTPEFQHIQPFWFYMPVLLAALVPWSLAFLWDAIFAAFKSRFRGQVNDFNWFLISWFGFTILFFTISKSKLPGYILPALPPLALLAGQRIKSQIAQPRLARWFFSIAGLTLILLGFLVHHFSDFIPLVTDIRPAPGIAQFSFFAVLGGIVATASSLFRWSTASGLTVVLTVLALLTMDTRDLWELDEGVSARLAVAMVLEHVTHDQAAAATTFKLRHGYKYQVDYYLHRETQEWTASYNRHSVIFTSYKNWRELEALGVRCGGYIAFPAVTLCEDSKGEPILMRGSTGSGQPH